MTEVKFLPRDSDLESYWKYLEICLDLERIQKNRYLPRDPKLGSYSNLSSTTVVDLMLNSSVCLHSPLKKLAPDTVTDCTMILARSLRRCTIVNDGEDEIDARGAIGALVLGFL